MLLLVVILHFPPNNRLEDNIKVGLRKAGCGAVGLVEVAQDTV
jgi:Icc-related predicted phosphoesterase